MVAVVNALVVYLEIGRSAKLALAGTSGLWIGFAAAASASGWLTISDPFPIMGIFVAARRCAQRFDQSRKIAIRIRMRATAAVPYFTSLRKPS